MPVVALVVGYVMLRAHLLGAASFAVNTWQGTGVESGFTRGMNTQLASMALLLPDTLRMMVLPFGMTMDPVIPYDASLASPSVWLGAGLLVVLTAWGLRAPTRHPLRFLGVCLAWGCAMPWVLKPLNHPYLEHRLYGVVAGLVMVAVAALPRLEPAALRRRVRVPAALALVLLAWISSGRSLDFRSQERLWTLELARNPDSKVAAAGMAVCLIESGRFGEAKPHLERLVAAYPHRRDARMNLAEAELQLAAAGAPSKAVVHARYLVAHWPQNPFYRLLLSRALAASGARSGRAQLFDEAVAEAMHCLKIAPPKALVYRTAANARRLQGDQAAALAILDTSLACGLDHYLVLVDRSHVLKRLGRVREAREGLLRARQRNPFDARVLSSLRALGSLPSRPR